MNYLVYYKDKDGDPVGYLCVGLHELVEELTALLEIGSIDLDTVEIITKK